MIRRRLKHIWSQQPHQCIPRYPAICWWSLEPVHVASSGIKWVSQKYLKIQYVEIQSKDASENEKLVLPLSGTTFVVSDCDFWCYSCDAWLWFCVFFTGTRRKKRAWPGQNSGRQTVLAIFRVLIGSISDMRKVMFELIVLRFLGLIKVKSLVFPLPPRPWQPWDPPRPDKRKWPPTGCWDSGAGTCSPQIQNTTRQINAQKISKDAWCDALSTRNIIQVPDASTPSSTQLVDFSGHKNRFDISNVPYFLGSKSIGAEIHMCVGFSPNAPWTPALLKPKCTTSNPDFSWPLTQDWLKGKSEQGNLCIWW